MQRWASSRDHENRDHEKVAHDQKKAKHTKQSVSAAQRTSTGQDRRPPSGTPMYVGEENRRKVTARIITYTPDSVEETADADVVKCRAAFAAPGIC